MKTDTSEKGLEALIVGHMTAGGGWIAGRPEDYDRNYAIDIVEVAAFIDDTQPGLVEALDQRFGRHRTGTTSTTAL